MGENVRYDGEHCLLRGDVIVRLKHHYDLIPICPEVMAGMSVPREPIELKDGKVINKQGDDLTESFTSVKQAIKTLVKNHQIKDALFKEFSPSCGSSKIYSGDFDGQIIDGQGLIAAFCQELGINIYSEETVLDLLK